MHATRELLKEYRAETYHLSRSDARPQVTVCLRDRPCLWALASMTSGGSAATLSIINLDLTRNLRATVTIPDRPIRSTSATVLCAADLHARNTAADPHRVVPVDARATLQDGRITHEFPAHSVTVFRIDLAAAAR